MRIPHERSMSNNRNELDVDKVIEQLLSVRQTPGKQVSVRSLCHLSINHSFVAFN